MSSFTKNGINKVTQSECQKMKSAGVMADNVPIKCDRLFMVNFKYLNFNYDEQEGRVIVFDVVAESIENIFQKLYERKFLSTLH